MKTTTYICDKCNKSVSEKELVGIEARVENISFASETDFTPGGGRKRATVRLELCKDCLRKYGFVIHAVTKENEAETVTQNSKTLEAKILDILDDLGVAFVK